MGFQESWWNIFVSSLMILTASVFLDVMHKNRQTDAGENPYPATAVGVGHSDYRCRSCTETGGVGANPVDPPPTMKWCCWWRVVRSCSTSSMRYSECISSCPRTCSNVYSVSAASTCDAGRCYPGCECPSGTFLSTHNDDHHGQSTTPSLICVPVDDCPCRYQGDTYPPRSVVEVNCNTWYELVRYATTPNAICYYHHNNNNNNH